MLVLASMSTAVCTTCQKTKAPLQCGVCESSLCKSCAQFLEEERLSFLPTKAPVLCHAVYCGVCFDTHVEPELRIYDDLLEKAADVNVFLKSQGKETRLLKRREDVVKIKDAADEQEAMLRLAFLAARAGFNSIIDVEIVSKKIRMGSYQTMVWDGSGMPIHVEERKIIKDRSTWSSPN